MCVRCQFNGISVQIASHLSKGGGERCICAFLHIHEDGINGI